MGQISNILMGKYSMSDVFSKKFAFTFYHLIFHEST